MKRKIISTAIFLTLTPVVALAASPEHVLSHQDDAVVIVCNANSGSQSYLPVMTQNSAGTATAVCPQGSYPAAAGLTGGQGLMDAVATAAGIGGAASYMGNKGAGSNSGLGSPNTAPSSGSPNSGNSRSGAFARSGSNANTGTAGNPLSQLHNVSANAIPSLATPEITPVNFSPSSNGNSGSQSASNTSGGGALSTTSPTTSSVPSNVLTHGSGGFFGKIGSELGNVAENVGHSLMAGPLFNNSQSGAFARANARNGGLTGTTPVVSAQPLTKAQKQALFEKDLGGPVLMEKDKALLGAVSNTRALMHVFVKYGLTSTGQNYALMLNMLLANQQIGSAACVGSMTTEKMAFDEIPYDVGLETSRMGNYWEKAVQQMGINSKSGVVGVGYMTEDYQITGPDIYNFNGVQILMPYHFGAYITYIDIKGFKNPPATSMENKYNPYISESSPSISGYKGNGNVPDTLYVGPSGLGWKAASSQQAFIDTAQHSAGVITTFDLNVPKIPCHTPQRLSVVKNVFKGQNLVSLQMQFKTNTGYVAPYSQAVFHNTQDASVHQICQKLDLKVVCGNYGLIEIK
jgi:hypothetical protein